MADARAILEASRALQRILQSELSVLAIPPGQIKIESIDLLPDPVPPPRITLFLFNIHEDPFLKNRYGDVAPAGPGSADVSPPPVVLDLDYIICAWAATTDEEHQLLGDIIRVLYDHAEIEGAALGPSWGPGEAIQVSLSNPSIEEQTRIWSTFGFKRFKLSLFYKVRSVPIDSRRKTRESLVRERHEDVRPHEPPGAGDLPAGVP